MEGAFRLQITADGVVLGWIPLRIRRLPTTHGES